MHTEFIILDIKSQFISGESTETKLLRCLKKLFPRLKNRLSPGFYDLHHAFIKGTIPKFNVPNTLILLSRRHMNI